MQNSRGCEADYSSCREGRLFVFLFSVPFFLGGVRGEETGHHQFGGELDFEISRKRISLFSRHNFARASAKKLQTWTRHLEHLVAFMIGRARREPGRLRLAAQQLPPNQSIELLPIDDILCSYRHV